MRCPVRSRYPKQPQRSFIVLEDANDYASSSRNTNFKPLVLGEIQTVGDTTKLALRFCRTIAGQCPLWCT
jgi:hypothetical protein